MGAITFTLKLNNFKKGFIDTTKNRAKSGMQRGLMFMGGWIAKTAKNSIKPSAMHSKKAQAGFLIGTGGERYAPPGSPPLSKLGFLRRMRYEWNEAGQYVCIGPAPLPRKSKAHTGLELGVPTMQLIGKGVSRHWELRPMRARPYMRPALKKALARERKKSFFKNFMDREAFKASRTWQMDAVDFTTA